MFQPTPASIEVVTDSLGFLFGMALVFGPFVYAIFILRQLDTAAKRRKEAFGKTKFRFMIVDFLSLILMIQMPFSFFALDLRDDPVAFTLVLLSLIPILLVWLATIRTVSQAGIDTFGWRALISMILIPTMYMGSFCFGPASLNLLFGNGSNEVIVWLAICVVGMVVSPWIVRGALKSASEPNEVEPKSKSPDPFAD